MIAGFRSSLDTKGQKVQKKSVSFLVKGQNCSRASWQPQHWQRPLSPEVLGTLIPYPDPKCFQNYLFREALRSNKVRLRKTPSDHENRVSESCIPFYCFKIIKTKIDLIIIQSYIFRNMFLFKSIICCPCLHHCSSSLPLFFTPHNLSFSFHVTCIVFPSLFTNPLTSYPIYSLSLFSCLRHTLLMYTLMYIHTYNPYERKYTVFV